MAKTAMIRARIEADSKQRAELIFKSLGMTSTDAISIFYRQVIMQKGLPFEVKIPNKVTRATFKDTDNGLNIKQAQGADDLFKKLKI